MNKDTINLRNAAEFEIEVFPDVFWIPANMLGHTRYTEEDIKSILLLSPSEKQSKINNLYEAIQLYQASKFKGMIDNVRVLEEDTVILWVFHKTGFDSVRTNEGCCAADSNWLSYILDDNYDEIGCFCFCQSDGNGHITNYIKHNGWYYFLDMMMQRYDSVQDTVSENGDIDDYNKNYMSAYIHKAKNFDAYIKYCLEKHDNPPILFYKTKKSECVSIGNEYMWEENQAIKGWNLVQKSNKFLFYADSIEILYSENDSVYELKDSKAVEPNWSSIKSFDFQVL
jgi:hypothetical protein